MEEIDAELMAEFMELYPKMVSVLGRLKMAADRIGGSVYLPHSIARGYIDAGNAAQGALSWIALPATRIEVKMRKPDFEPGQFYQKEMRYIEE